MAKRTAFQRDVLKLAKAMEQGIKKTRPTSGEYVKQKDLASGKTSKVIYACALGAAWVNGYSLKRAMAGLEQMVNEQDLSGTTIISDALTKRYPALKDTGIFGAVIDRNDSQEWPRGRIAAWLVRVAAKYPEAQLPGFRDYVA